jgi:hypothetical protein
MADALNQRIHQDTIAADAPTVSGSRGQRIAVGDLIITRHNDASIPLRNIDHPATEKSPVRNGQRWQVTAINAEHCRLVARRIDDNAYGVFFSDYVRTHVTHGYAITAHSAQGATADTVHAVLSDTTTRALSYVAITRGRNTNTAYLYQRFAEAEHPQKAPPAAHVERRGTSHQAARLLRAVLANDEQSMTAHRIAAMADQESLPVRVRDAIDQRAAARRDRATEYQRWRTGTAALGSARREGRGHNISRDRSHDYGLEI